MNIDVRMYVNSDLEGVNKILKEAFNIKKENNSYNDCYEIVSLTDEKISGYLLLTKVYNPVKNIYYGLIDYVCVLSKYRGTGTSDKLIEYAFEVSKKIGLDYLQLTCAPFRIGVQKLYKRNGFVLRYTNVYRKEIL